jgi:hypothetical protein
VDRTCIQHQLPVNGLSDSFDLQQQQARNKAKREQAEAAVSDALRGLDRDAITVYGTYGRSSTRIQDNQIAGVLHSGIFERVA